jgi:hypothetical protein
VATEQELAEVKKRVSARLLSLPGISGVGVQKEPSGEFVLAIHLDADTPAIAANLPREIEGHPVKVVLTEAFSKG